MRWSGQANDGSACFGECFKVVPLHAACQHMAANRAEKRLDAPWVCAVQAGTVQDLEMAWLGSALDVSQNYLHCDQPAIMLARLPQVRQ